MTAIIIINWNGADDTIACLDSLNKAQGDFMVVVADNGSTDDSLDRIRQFVSGLSIKVDIIPLGNNWGFAQGNNRAIQYAAKYKPDSYMLLNNDTEVEPDFLVRIEEYRNANPQIKILGPIIRYWYDRDRIWSCGGKLIFGSRKAYFRDCKVSEVSDSPLPVTFISGCSLFVDASLLNPDGSMLTDRFFFGEEDYEFALRMFRRGEKMVIVRQSTVYHKVGSATNTVSEKAIMGRHYIYYLSRLIVAREYYNCFQFLIIRLLSYRRCIKYFIKDGLSADKARSVVCRLMHDAKAKYGVNYDDFKSMVIDGTFFDSI